LLIFGGLDAQGQVSEEQIIYDPNARFRCFLPLIVREYAP